ncbi:Polysaccharide biosynthesis protein [Rubripirellula tenax]|uniref:Polysaccharide biosynthesis protein n=1 Tax=Rubripirellula tenax TaxID=2528015 RepID=A0A5C6FH30_9BACT|nr:oligosaccharide flippase family protein [Rubripirellula tenax]TWU60170.1 Polysaccharide biosynthesis protein [Rubripirellula tenax]
MNQTVRQRVIGFATRRTRGSREHAQASAVLAVGYVAQLVFQMGYFLVLTRMLGVERFGQFATALAAINLVSPFAGIGYAEVALVRISSNRDETGLWATNSVAATVFLGIPLSIALALACYLFNSPHWIDWYLMLGLALGELTLVRGCNVLARVHQARREITRTSMINVAIAAVKAVVAFGLLIAGQHSLLLLIIFLNMSLLPLLVYLFHSMTRFAPYHGMSWSALNANMGLAFSFTSGVFSKAVYTDLDKLFLARWTAPEIVGMYAAGYKMLSLAFLPIRSILEATFPRQVERAAISGRSCATFSLGLLAANVGLASIMSVAIYVMAPWAPLILGRDFTDSVAILRIGCILPMLQASHYSMGNYLTAIGRQTVRSTTQMTIVAAYVVIAFLLIPTYSWHGAIWTSLACEGLLVVLFAIACMTFKKK